MTSSENNIGPSSPQGTKPRMKYSTPASTNAPILSLIARANLWTRYMGEEDISLMLAKGKEGTICHYLYLNKVLLN